MLKITIAGAGIGGLTTALCLAKAGFSVHILEQANELNEVGAGLQCGANAMHVLGYLGLTEKIKQVGVQPEAVQFKNYRTGKLLHQLTLGKDYEKTYGAPYLHIHRADLQSILFNCANQEPNITISFNTQVASFKESPNHVQLLTANKETFTSDILIGADGIKSAIREQLVSQTSCDTHTANGQTDYQPKFTGHYAWRAVVRRDQLPKNFMPKIASNFVGPGKHMVIYYLRQQQLVNMVGIVDTQYNIKDSNPVDTQLNTLGPWMEQASWEALHNDFKNWHPTVNQLIKAIDKNHCYRWGLFAHKPLNRWCGLRTALLGDAAHATLPYMASGAAMAIEDARILSRCLKDSLEKSSTTASTSQLIANALTNYEAHRLPRTREIQKSSARLGTIYHLKSEYLQRAAFWGIKHLAGKKERFLPEYNANTIPINKA